MNKKDLLNELERSGIKKEIIEAINKVDRKDFVLSQNKDDAYLDLPLPIGYGQTISQPFTVAFMLQQLELKEGDKVLEVGTGSGWNAALISRLIGKTGELYTIEIIKELFESAEFKLKQFKNIKLFNVNGGEGLIEFSPYDKIIFTAAPIEIKSNIKYQLKNNGIILAPVGTGIQKLIKIRRNKDKFLEQDLGSFVFVPLVS